MILLILISFAFLPYIPSALSLAHEAWGHSF